MSNETKTTGNDRLTYLVRYAKRQVERREGIIKERMERLTEDFADNFEWNAEEIFKSQLKRDYFKTLHDNFAEEGCDLDRAIFLLKHSVEHLTDDIIHGDPYCNSFNAATNLAHRWRYEANKEIRNAMSAMLGAVTEE